MRAAALLVLAGCSSLADSGGGKANLPNAAAGPFRAIEGEELGAGRAAPYVLKDDDDFPRNAVVIDADGDAATLATWIYAAHRVTPDEEEPDPSVPPGEIIRAVAEDGRSFARAFDVVLRAEEAWEGGVVDRPAVVVFGGEHWLFYAGAGGIGAAKGSDGVTFTRVGSGPVLAPSGGWEAAGMPTSPAVLVAADGSLRMYYEVPLAGGSAIGEARSSDGASWERVGTAPIFAPAEEGIDAGGTAEPYALMMTTPEGRSVEQLYYTAIDAMGIRLIGYAARFEGEASFTRALSPVFGGDGDLVPGEPCVLRYGGFSLLYVTEKAGETEALDYPAIAAGVAPADAVLPPAAP
jgi:hypothetical protein